MLRGCRSSCFSTWQHLACPVQFRVQTQEAKIRPIRDVTFSLPNLGDAVHLQRKLPIRGAGKQGRIEFRLRRAGIRVPAQSLHCRDIFPRQSRGFRPAAYPLHPLYCCSAPAHGADWLTTEASKRLPRSPIAAPTRHGVFSHTCAVEVAWSRLDDPAPQRYTTFSQAPRPRG